MIPILARLWNYSPDVFDSQMFWNHMDMITDENIDNIQNAIANVIINEFKINPYGLLYDTTNFFTYIATGNKRNSIAKRGRNKAKRNDLRQVGLALLISKDYQIPLFHKVYSGNRTDNKLFIEISDEIVEWQDKHFGYSSKTTLVIDKGNISEDAMARLIIGNKHYVCAVPKSTCKELYSTDIEKMTNVPGLPGTKAYSTWLTIWDKAHKAIVCYSDSYFAANMTDLMNKLQKCEEKLRDYDKELEKGPQRTSDKRHFTKSSIARKINEIITDQIKNLISYELKKIKGLWRIEYEISQSKIDELMKRELGRTLIISSRLDWDDKAIISAYRSQQGIEDIFKHFKHRDYLHWQPEFHWTDSKIKVHGLYCVLAMLLACLAHREVIRSGIEISLVKMIDELNVIREVALIYKDKEKEIGKNELTLSRMSSMQKKLSQVLEVPEILKRK